MADIQPLRALYYDLGKVGRLDDVISPPYDIIDKRQRAALGEHSPYNVVAVDMPDGDGDRYEHAGALLSEWLSTDVLIRDRQDAFWILEQRYLAPDGTGRRRRGLFARVKIESYEAGRINLHERTHPGPIEDRLKLTRATKTNLSPIFSLFDDGDGRVRNTLAPVYESQPWANFQSSEGLADTHPTANSLWRVTDQDAIQVVHDALAKSDLLIADGHHRFATAQAYAEEIGGHGPQEFVLMLLVALQDPGLIVFPTHRLLFGLDDEQQKALALAIESDWLSTPIDTSTDQGIKRLTGEGKQLESVHLSPQTSPIEIGYLDNTGKALLLTPRDTSVINDVLKDKPNPYRELDTAVLEALILKRALGMSDDDIEHNRGLRYARSTTEAIEKVQDKSVDVAFFMRSTPVETIRDIAQTGETMPPKTTYFFPKIPTGIVFNPLD